MEVEIKLLMQEDITDFRELINVFEAVFEMKGFSKSNSNHLLSVLAKGNFLALVAKVDDKVIGGLTAYILDQYYSEKPLAYIYDLAILNKYQRQGIGKNLIKHFTGYCKENSFKEVFVQADKIDNYALDFYRSTAITKQEDVVHFSYLL
jgi:aminoglycoside 3-N-acetyltransferase I